MIAERPICYCLAKASECDCLQAGLETDLIRTWLIASQVSSDLSRRGGGKLLEVNAAAV